MSPELIGLIGLVVLLIVLFLGVYISIAMALIGFVGSLILIGPLAALTNLYVVPFGLLKDFNFGVLPLFILMSDVISLAGIGKEAFSAARAWIGQVRGGLAMAAVGACGLFAATSGSSIACAIVMGKVAYPEMMRFKYSAKLAAGCLAAGGSVGVMIPPSMPFVTYGILTDTSIGKLFIAGIIPGITQVIFYFITIYIMCRFNPSLGPASVNLAFKEKLKSSGSVWPIAVLFILVIGGIYMGVFTPAESGAIGTVGALIIGFSRRSISGSGLRTTLQGTIKVSGMLLFLLTTAFILNNFVALSRLPFVAGQYIASLGINHYIILAIVLIVYIILGMFFDMMAIMVLTIPILFPVMKSLGFDPIWYGVLMCRMSEMGFITPPFGINLFTLTGTVGVPLETTYKGIIPFIIADLIHVVFLVAFPVLSTLLPTIMR
jgi:C4-dicarboxylate transporter, DctM subunit